VKNEQLILIQIIFANLTSIHTYRALSHNVGGLSMNSLAALAFVFFLDGFETSSTTITFCLYELSLYLYLQEYIREETDVLKTHDGKIMDKAIQEMEYLGKSCCR
jgi:cytochrome P450